MSVYIYKQDDKEGLFWLVWTVITLLCFTCSCVTIHGGADGPTSKRHKYTDAEMAIIWKKLSRCDKYPAKCKLLLQAKEKTMKILCATDLKKEQNKCKPIKNQLQRCKNDLEEKKKPQARQVHWAWVAVPAYIGGVLTGIGIYALVSLVLPDKK